jgi:hypothetical protein
MPTLSRLLAMKPENCFYKEKTIWLDTRYWSTQSIKLIKPENQPEKSPLTFSRISLGLVKTKSSLSTGMNLRKSMTFGNQSLVARPFRK